MERQADEQPAAALGAATPPGSRVSAAAGRSLPADTALLHGRVRRPPHLAWERLPTCSVRLLSIDDRAARRMHGVVDIVVRDSFVGVVATSDQVALRAAAALRVKWSAPQRGAHGAESVSQKLLVERGAVDSDFRGAAQRLDATYHWPLAAPLPVGGAVADCADGAATVWLDGETPGALQGEIAALLGLPIRQVEVICMRSGSPDAAAIHHAAADAALLSHAVRHPVHVRLARQDGWIADDAGYRLATRIESAVDANCGVTAYSVVTGAIPASAAPLALVLTGTRSPVVEVADGRGGASSPPYAFGSLRAVAGASPGAAPVANPYAAVAQGHIFAHESHLDELATANAVDPVEFRLRYVDDQRGAGLIRTVARQAGWMDGSHVDAAPSAIRRGRGFAYASVIEAEDDLRSWSAWVAEVEVDTGSGEVQVTRVVVGHEHERDSAQLEPSARLEERAADTARSLTWSAPAFDSWDAAPLPLAERAARQGPLVELAGEAAGAPMLRGAASATFPAAAAVANAIFDATGVRMREPPFTAERMRRALADQSAPNARRRSYPRLLAAAAVGAAALAALLPWRTAIAPVSPPPPGFYSAGTVERGRLVAAAGDCVVCHTAPGGKTNVGGLALETPFGVIYSTNITPDPATGIGAWSFAAFERAMREGVHRDGRQLYPALPYSAFAKVTDADMQSLYAYLMAQPAVVSPTQVTKLAFPFNMRPLMAGWNLLFHDKAQYQPDTAQSVEWNRGAYLADGLGHCSACHSPRNMFGAEKGGKAYLAGGVVEGWTAPALSALSAAPLQWTEEELFRYLRFGYSPLHGPAGGPMAPVVKGLAELPESDVRAIAVYIASFNAPAPALEPQQLVAQAAALADRSKVIGATLAGPGARLFEGACAVCHQERPLANTFGEIIPLTVNSNLHAADPDNLIRVVLQGVAAPAYGQAGQMPAFADSLNDRQVADLVGYMRKVYAPDQPAWAGVERRVAHVRASPGH